MSRSLARPATDIDDATQNGKKFRYALDFVQNHQPVGVSEQEGFRIVQLTLRRGKFQVEIKGICTLTRFSQRQGCLTSLTRPKEDNGRELA